MNRVVVLQKELQAGEGDHLLKLAEFSKSCLNACNAFPTCVALTNGSSSELAQAAMKAAIAVKKMLQRLQASCAAKVVLGVVNDGNQMPKDGLLTCLSREMQSILHALQRDWKVELDFLQNKKVADLMFKLQTFESAYSGMQSRTLQEEEALSKALESCKTYCDSFVVALQNAFNQEAGLVQEPFEKFNNEFKDLTPAAESGSLESVGWMFDKGSEEDIKKHIEILKAARKDGLIFDDLLSRLVQHVTASDALKGVFQAASSKKVSVQKCASEGSQLANLLIWCDAATLQGCDSAMLQSNERYTQKHFGLGRADLPAAVKSHLTDIESKKEHQKKRNSNAASVKEESEKKRSKKDKEKDKNKGHTRSSHGDEARSKKVKKSK